MQLECQQQMQYFSSKIDFTSFISRYSININYYIMQTFKNWIHCELKKKTFTYQSFSWSALWCRRNHNFYALWHFIEDTSVYFHAQVWTTTKRYYNTSTGPLSLLAIDWFPKLIFIRSPDRSIMKDLRLKSKVYLYFFGHKWMTKIVCKWNIWRQSLYLSDITLIYQYLTQNSETSFTDEN